MPIRISPVRPASGFAAARRVARFQRTAAISTLKQGNCLTVALNPATTSKQQVIDTLTRALTPSTTSNAALILASKSLAPWLQDATFLSHLLSPFPSSTLNVLSAAVDGIPHVSPHTNTYTPSEGLSVVYGPLDELLPGLWDTPPLVDGNPSLEFHLPALSRHHPRALSVTLPVANTLFNNGRPHTMLASRWHVGSRPSAELELIDVAERTAQLVTFTPGLLPSGTSRVATPLVPLTKARRVVASLGNILRQVEIDGRVVPASKELEEVIPRLLAARVGGEEVVGPMGVWAVVYPERMMAGGDKFPRVLEVGKEGEWERAREVEGMMGKLLAGGSHLRRILSGGGGWGLKQGLLSLDPQTKYSTADHEDVESFIRSFHGEDDGVGIVTPGSYVQLMVEPAGPPPEVQRGGSPSVIIGTQGGSMDSVPDDIQVQQGVFGGVSSHGIYVASETRGTRPGITTKIDVSRSYVISTED